jgi:hypothetical protein
MNRNGLNIVAVSVLWENVKLTLENSIAFGLVIFFSFNVNPVNKGYN